MTRRFAVAALALFLAACAEPPKREPTWSRVSEHVWRSPGTPAAYALIDGDAALLFGAPAGADPLELQYAGITGLEGVVLTHHHRDSVLQAPAWSGRGLTVRAPRASAPWLTPEGVQGFWRGFLPPSPPPAEPGAKARTFETWDYLVLPEGMAAVDCSLEDGRSFDWRGWTITPVATPGHSRGHMAYAARRKASPQAKPLVFCGDALAGPGTLWSPYTTDWDAAGDEGLRAAAASLRALLALDPDALFPEHGAAILDAPGAALTKAAEAAAEAAFLKSYERFTKERKKSPPVIKFLDRTQVGSDGRKPWTRLSDHLHFTGNMYAVSSRRNGMWIIDPSGELVAAQMVRGQIQRIGGDPELVTLTHPHGEHYSGLHELPTRGGALEVWVLDQIAGVVTDPAYRRAPHLHPRPVRVDRVVKDGETVTWRDYALNFRRLPGHSGFASAIVTEIDGKKVVFVGDSFLHPDQGGGSGGWSGFNGGFPGDYAGSAAAVLSLRPDWILASRGGPFEFVAADWERRVEWANAAAGACDRLSPSGRHRLDWDPNLVRVEPFLSRAAPAAAVRVEIIVTNPLDRPQTLGLEIAGRGFFADVRRSVAVEAHGSSRLLLPLVLRDTALPGTHVFPIRVLAGDVERGDDALFALDVGADGR